MTRPRRLGIFVLAALCFVLLSLPHLGATQKESAHAAIIIVTPEANKSTLEDFSWLAGRWEGHLGPTTAEQQWMTPKNGTMQGFFRLTDAEKTIVIELFTYHLNLTKSEGGVFRFDNPVANQLKDAILTRVDGDTYISHGDITDADGKPKAIEVAYHRVK